MRHQGLRIPHPARQRKYIPTVDMQADGRLIDVVHGVVSSVPFQMRRTSDFPPVVSLPSAEIKP